MHQSITSPKCLKTEPSKFSPHQYVTFPTPPPKSRGRPPYSPARSFIRDGNAVGNYCEDWDSYSRKTPLPKGQLLILAIISLAEQTSLNSISPYLPEMVSTFSDVSPENRGLAIGTLASAFALAQFVTSFFWGWLSDQIGRKPIVMFGTLSTAVCFLFFGACKNLWQAVLIQVFMGLVNGNQGIISSCLGEITNKSNQTRAFVYLPVIYGIGAVTGPALGGLMVYHENPFNKDQKNPFPYLIPNLFSAGVLIIVFILMTFFLEESLENSKDLVQIKRKMSINIRYHLQCILRSCNSSGKSICLYNELDNRTDSEDEFVENNDLGENRSLLSIPAAFDDHPMNERMSCWKGLNRDTIILLATYLVFQLSNISYNSLYPIFASEPEPVGRNLSVRSIGLSLSYSGLVAIFFQMIIFGKLKDYMGNKVTYRVGLLLIFFSMILTPWVGYSNSPPLFGWGNGRIWLWIELGFVLFLKTIASVSGLTAALLLITNSASSHSSLGTLNGLAQSLSAAGRAIGPILSGGLFSIATSKISWRGEVVPWYILGAITFLSFLASFGISNSSLESFELDGQDSVTDDGNQ